MAEPAGTVELLVTGPKKGEPLAYVPSVHVRAAHGIEGDRYFCAEPYADATRDLTLIEAEALEALQREHGIVLEAREARRNVVTRGISLNPLVGRRFVLGDVQCIGMKLCEPCAYLESMTHPGLMRGLAHRGGLRAAIVNDGTIAVGDDVVPL